MNTLWALAVGVVIVELVCIAMTNPVLPSAAAMPVDPLQLKLASP